MFLVNKTNESSTNTLVITSAQNAAKPFYFVSSEAKAKDVHGSYYGIYTSNVAQTDDIRVQLLE